MLKNLFSNRLFMGALAFFILCVGGSLLYQQHVERQSARELAETQERIKASTEKPPTTAQAPVGDTSQGGHWHGDEWHAEPHESPKEAAQMPPVETQIGHRPVSEMSIEERIKAIVDGVIQPPKGYRYIWADSNVLRLDENGNPILLREGEPFFEIVPCIGFAPTREEFRQYQQLQQDRVDAIKRGDDAEADRLNQARRRFYESHRGEIPSISWSGGTRGVDYTEETRKLLYAAYIEAGFDYLVPDEYR